MRNMALFQTSPGVTALPEACHVLVGTKTINVSKCQMNHSVGNIIVPLIFLDYWWLFLVCLVWLPEIALMAKEIKKCCFWQHLLQNKFVVEVREGWGNVPCQGIYTSSHTTENKKMSAWLSCPLSFSAICSECGALLTCIWDATSCCLGTSFGYGSN